MKAVLQRVSGATVRIDGDIRGQIGKGLLILLGVAPDDTEREARILAEKIQKLRIFNDSDEKMNLSLLDVNGEALIISNFTLYADYRHGNRPNYLLSAKPEIAEPLYEYFVSCMREAVPHVDTGEFGAHMHVALENDGPVTITVDTDILKPKES